MAGSAVHRTNGTLQIFDLLTVNETAYEPPEDDRDSINSVFSLSREASMINQNFTQQAQRSAAVECRDCCSANAHRAVGRWGGVTHSEGAGFDPSIVCMDVCGR